MRRRRPGTPNPKLSRRSHILGGTNLREERSLYLRMNEQGYKHIFMSQLALAADFPGPDLSDTLSVLRAAAEETRLRILALLVEGDLSVSDLTDILGQSQPRISRHLKLLAEAGLIERHREGAWAFSRLGERAASAQILRAILS